MSDSVTYLDVSLFWPAVVLGPISPRSRRALYWTTKWTTSRRPTSPAPSPSRPVRPISSSRARGRSRRWCRSSPTAPTPIRRASSSAPPAAPRSPPPSFTLVHNDPSRTFRKTEFRSCNWLCQGPRHGRMAFWSQLCDQNAIQPLSLH